MYNRSFSETERQSSSMGITRQWGARVQRRTIIQKCICLCKRYENKNVLNQSSRTVVRIGRSSHQDTRLRWCLLFLHTNTKPIVQYLLYYEWCPGGKFNRPLRTTCRDLSCKLCLLVNNLSFSMVNRIRNILIPKTFHNRN